jgi:hypothetical protein
MLLPFDISIEHKILAWYSAPVKDLSPVLLFIQVESLAKASSKSLLCLE